MQNEPDETEPLVDDQDREPEPVNPYAEEHWDDSGRTWRRLRWGLW